MTEVHHWDGELELFELSIPSSHDALSMALLFTSFHSVCTSLHLIINLRLSSSVFCPSHYPQQVATDDCDRTLKRLFILFILFSGKTRSKCLFFFFIWVNQELKYFDLFGLWSLVSSGCSPPLTIIYVPTTTSIISFHYLYTCSQQSE